MHPELCKIGPFTIYSFGLFLMLAFLVAAGLVRRQAKKENINPDFIFNLSFLTFLVAIAGARFLYVLSNLKYYTDNPLEIIMLQHGGLSWFGGLIFGVAFAVVYLKKKKLSVYKVLDLVVPFLALAQAIGRIGCFLNGCCFGRVSEFGIYFPVHKAILIPTQIYSSLTLIVIFVVLRIIQKRPHKDGEVFFTYLVLYCTKRFFMEFLRADTAKLFFDFSLFQIFSIIIFCLSFIKLILIKKAKN